jgi:hypothetical protein
MNPDYSAYGFVPLDLEEEESPSVENYGFIPFDENGEPIPNEKAKSPSSLPQKIASSPVGQAVLGGLKRFTYPADILKLAMIGEGLSDLDSLEETYRQAGKEFDRDEYIRKVYEAAEAIPTQQLGEELVKKYTRLDLEPQERMGKIARRAGEIFTLQPGSIASQPGKELAKRGAASLTGSTTSEGLEALGVPEPLAELAGFALGSGLSEGKIVEKALSEEGKAARETAEKFGLRRIRGAEEEPSGAPAIISKRKQENLTRELGETSKQAIDDIIEQRLPIKARREAGIDLEEAYTRAYDRAQESAHNIDASIKKGEKKPINFDPLLEFIDKKINDLRGKAPSISDSDKVVLNLLKKERHQLTQAPDKKAVILSPSGESFKSSPKARISKNSTASQVLEQYKNFNDNVRGIYKKPEFSGAESKIKDTYAQLNKKLIESLEKSGENELAHELKFANKIFGDTQKLNQTEAILGKAFENGYDPKKLLKTIGGKANRAFLERNLGKEAVQDLKDIASYGERAHRMVLSKIKNPKSVGEYISSLTPLKAGLLYLSHGTLPAAIAGIEIAKGSIPRLQGALLTRKTTSKAYKNFLKAASSPKSSVFKKASEELSKAIINEFGSEEELINFAKERE